MDDAKADFYRNGDPAGTPEAFKRLVVRGGTGTGGNNYTGGSSNSKSVAAGPFEPPTLGSLSGTIYQDGNGDHLLNSADDFGFEGIEVDLLNANGILIKSTFTDVNGSYSFTDLAAGTYQVEMVVPDPIFNTMLPEVGTSGGTVDSSWALVTEIALGSGATAIGYNFGVWVSGS